MNRQQLNDEVMNALKALLLQLFQRAIYLHPQKVVAKL